MKKVKLLLMAVIFLIFGAFNNSCFGPFNLTLKLHNWNSNVGDKWVNTLVFWGLCIVQVYEITLFLDGIIFNVLEFWTGSNPISMNEGDEEIQMVKSGNKEYMIKATKNKFHIEQVTGQQKGEWVDIIFNPEDYSCYMHYKGEEIKLAEYLHAGNGNDLVNLFLPDGKIISVDANQRNLNIYQAALNIESNLAIKE